MQSGIAAAVSDSLKVAILADERRALDEFPTTNLKAYESYVAGRYQLDLLSHESLPRAIKLFDEAIALDPQFFDAYIARSDAYRQLFCLLRAADQHAAAGGRLALRGAGAAPRFGRGLVFSRPDLRDGLALEGCLDRVEQGEAARPDARADGTGVCAVLLRARRSGKGQAVRWPTPSGSTRSTRKWRIGATGLCSWWAKARQRASGSIERCSNTRTSGYWLPAQVSAPISPVTMKGPCSLRERGAEQDGSAVALIMLAAGVWLCGTERKGAPAAGESCERRDLTYARMSRQPRISASATPSAP